MVKDIAILTPLYTTVFWAIVLLSNYSKSKPKFLLGIFMSVAFLLYLSHAFFFSESYFAYFDTEWLYLLSSLSVYPLYFCYIKLLTIDRVFKFKNIIHFLPAIILSVASFIAGLFFTHQQQLDYIEFFVMRKESFGFELLSPPGIKSWIFVICRIVFVLQVFFYLLNGAILTQQHDRRIANFYSDTEGKSLIWVRMVTFSILATSIMSITFAIIGRNLFMNNPYLLLIPSLIFSTLLYLIGYLGNITVQVIVESNHPESNPDRYRNANTKSIRDKLLHLFKEDKVFKNPDLLLSNLSETLQTSNAEVSQLINEEFKTDFRDFVNKYRISVAKDLIINNIHNLNLENVATESGFRSLATFTKVFKSYEGITPQKFEENSRSK